MVVVVRTSVRRSHIAVVNYIFLNISFFKKKNNDLNDPTAKTSCTSRFHSSISGPYQEINLLKTKLALLLLIMNGGVGSKPHPHDVAFVTTRRPNSLAIF